MKLYNLQEFYLTIRGRVIHKATLYYNIPYPLAKFKKRIAEQNKKNPKGTFFKIIQNV